MNLIIKVSHYGVIFISSGICYKYFLGDAPTRISPEKIDVDIIKCTRTLDTNHLFLGDNGI